ncbi:hypothetical protein HEBU111660_00220 [Helicobacter burdigaliensis]
MGLFTPNIINKTNPAANKASIIGANRAIKILIKENK